MNDIIVISDTHFGAGKNNLERESAFLDLLKEQRGKDIVLLGDIFDFWIEYKSAIYRRYFNVLCGISRFIDEGGRVYFVPGNHDFYSTEFLAEIGMEVRYRGITVEWKNKKVYMHHGDIFSRKGRFNRFFYGNPFTRFVFKMFHPNIGLQLASMVSKTSYKKPVRGKVAIPQGIRELFKDYDIVITGHTHTAGILEIGSGKYYINAGEWLFGKSYVEITEKMIAIREGRNIIASIDEHSML